MSKKKSMTEKRCDEIYVYITKYVAQNGYSPTFREVGMAIGLRLPSTISRYIHMLVDAGRFLLMNPSRAPYPPPRATA